MERPAVQGARTYHKQKALDRMMVAREEDKDTNGSSPQPFIHKVATENRKYIFDVNTGEILLVDEVVWEIYNTPGFLDQ